MAIWRRPACWPSPAFCGHRGPAARFPRISPRRSGLRTTGPADPAGNARGRLDANQTPQSRYEAPAIITTVTREQIEVWGYRSVAELLSNHLGFYVIDDHQSPNIAVRGNSGGLYSDSSIIKVLINGQPIPFTPTGGTGLGPELIPLSAIEQVEIIRGPASSLYGADAFLGMVNIRTREGKQVNGVTAWLAGGSLENNPAPIWTSPLALRGVGWRPWWRFVTTSRIYRGCLCPVSSPAPRIPDYHTGPLVAEGLVQDSLSALGTLTFRPRPGRSAGLLGHYSQRERGSEFGSIFQLAHGLNAQGVFSENRVSQDQLRIGLQLEGELSSRLRLSLRSSYFQGAAAKTTAGGPAKTTTWRWVASSTSCAVRWDFAAPMPMRTSIGL